MVGPATVKVPFHSYPTDHHTRCCVQQPLEVAAKTIPIVNMFLSMLNTLLTLVKSGVSFFAAGKASGEVFPRSKISRCSASTRATALRRANGKPLFKLHKLLKELLGFGNWSRGLWGTEIIYARRTFRVSCRGG